MTKIISYNLNGIRAAIKKGLIEWLKQTDPDIFCLQELKAHEDQVDLKEFREMGYHIYWFAAEKKGYSGVAVFTKIKPNHVEYGVGEEKYDREGRVLRLDFESFSSMSVYMPSGTSGSERQAFKMEWLDYFYDYIQNLINEKKHLVISGDFNICHKPIDIHNPVSNKNSTGFLPEEREWISKFLEGGFIDTFRHFNTEPHNYTWWTYRLNARDRNLGWRIDYHMASRAMERRLKRAAILNKARHSDHCPLLVEIE
jgi:exodeoxyribonuclease-3